MFHRTALITAVVAASTVFVGWALTRPPAVATLPTGWTSSIASVISASRDLGPVDPDQSIRFLISLRDDSEAQTAEVIRGLYEPGSPSFGDYGNATRAEQLGPIPEEVEWLREQMAAAGLTSDWRVGRAWLSASGRAADVGGAFGVSIRRYRSRSGRDFLAPPTTPLIPAAWRHIATAVDDLSDYLRVSTSAVRAGGMTPTDILTGYDIAPLRAMGLDGSGETVVVTVPADGLEQATLDTFTTRFGLPPIDVGPVKVDDPTTLTPIGELEMDLEVIHAIAPAARLVVYASKSGKTVDMAGVQDRAVKENPGAILSESWGSCERADSTATLDAADKTYGDGAMNGVTVFISSGDNGAYTCLDQNDDWGTPPAAGAIGASSPSTSSYVTSVGGTRLSLRSDGSYFSEETWSWPALTEASGGGPSTYYARPDWQVAPGVPAATAGAMRLTPDVAADAESGMAINLTGRGLSTGGGTSQSAPIWAGMTALINQYLQQQGLPRAGFLNEALYAIARGPSLFPAFHDVVLGSNLVDPASAGWDSSTGLGSPDAFNLARDLEQYMRAGR